MLCRTPARNIEYVSARDQGSSLTRNHRRRPDVLTSFSRFVLTMATIIRIANLNVIGPEGLQSGQ